MTVCFLGLFVNGRYHTACRYSGPLVWNSASVTFWKICYYGRQCDLIWCNDTYTVKMVMFVINFVRYWREKKGVMSLHVPTGPLKNTNKKTQHILCLRKYRDANLVPTSNAPSVPVYNQYMWHIFYHSDDVRIGTCMKGDNYFLSPISSVII